MTPRTLPITIVLLTLRMQIAFTLRRLLNHPLTQALPITGLFAQALVKWASIQQQELELEDNVDDSQMKVAAADHPLDIFARRLSDAILLLTGNNRASDLYLHFFGNKTLYEFIRPNLADQLEAMAQWIPSLQGSEHPSLVALGAELPELIDRAKLAETGRSTAEQQKKDFREVGDRMKFVEEVNSLRKEAHGVLATLPHKYPGLSSKFVAQFFRRDRVKKGEEVTIDTLAEDIGALQEELTGKEALRSEMEAAEEAAAKKAAQEAAAREEAKSELEAIKKDLAVKQKRAAELEAILDT